MTDKLTCPRCGRLLRRIPMTQEFYGVPEATIERLWCDTCLIFIDDNMADKVNDEKTSVRSD